MQKPGIQNNLPMSNLQGRKPSQKKGELLSPDLTARLIAYRPFFEQAQTLLLRCRKMRTPTTLTQTKIAISYGGCNYDKRPLSKTEQGFIDGANLEFLRIVADNPALSPRINIRSEFPYTISFKL